MTRVQRCSATVVCSLQFGRESQSTLDQHITPPGCAVFGADGQGHAQAEGFSSFIVIRVTVTAETTSQGFSPCPRCSRESGSKWPAWPLSGEMKNAGVRCARIPRRPGWWLVQGFQSLAPLACGFFLNR